MTSKEELDEFFRNEQDFHHREQRFEIEQNARDEIEEKEEKMAIEREMKTRIKELLELKNQDN